jgi:ABC-type transport system involved in cytochrome c biogenesis permease subunit
VAFVILLVMLGGAFRAAVKELLPKKDYLAFADYEPWSEDVIETAKGIPVQDGGRVKPLESYAGYLMLGMRGDRLMKVLDRDGEKVKITPTEWVMDALFRPHLAIQLPSFRVDNSDVMERIGLEGKAKRDRYSYEELMGARESLLERGSEYEKLSQGGAELDPVQKQTLSLAQNLRMFEALVGYFSFARAGVELKGAGEDGEPTFQRVSTVMATADVIQSVLRESRETDAAPPAHVQDLLRQITEYSNAARYGFVMLPPSGDDKEWDAAGNAIFEVMTMSSADAELAIKDIAALESLVVAQSNGRFPKALKEWRSGIETRAEARGELRALPLELKYNKANWFFTALFFCFVPGTLFLVLSWISPRSLWGRVMSWLVWGTCSLGLLLLVIGITQRSLIMWRPPVGNLYDTIPFITAGAVLLALIAEGLTRRRLALAVAPMLGFFGLVMARRYEFGDPSDPMDPLLAVLRSNYWLTIHVLVITLGYAAGLLTAAVGHVYVFLRVLGLDKGDKGVRRVLTRITYGCVGFTLLLSLVGTVLGGIWANDSWGRFWGWDPKENGALMIVLWSLFILHARMGGIIKEWGINLWAIFGAVVVTFSWWHVNLLGVGLHSYGFSDSKRDAVFWFYKFELIVLLLGIGFMIYEKVTRRQRKEAARMEAAPSPQAVEG